MSQVVKAFLRWCQAVTDVLKKKASISDQRELTIALYEFKEAVKALENDDTQ